MTRRAWIWLPFPVLLGFATLSGCRPDSDDVVFPKQVEESCRTREGCLALLAELSKKRDYCYREYAGEQRPLDCDQNDLYWWALKDHIELTELRAQAQAWSDPEAAANQERQALARERNEWQQERERAARIDKSWRELDPRKCAVEGDEDACYQLVRFISLGPSPHLDEAKAALASGQQLIEQRKKR